MADEVQAHLEVAEDGQLVLVDPQAFAAMLAVNKHNCLATAAVNAERIAYFKERVVTLGRTAVDTVIVILNVDDPNGGALAAALMPGMDRLWQGYRDEGKTPYARGLAVREGVLQFVYGQCHVTREEVESVTGLAVVIVDHGTAVILQA